MPEPLTAEALRAVILTIPGLRPASPAERAQHDPDGNLADVPMYIWGGEQEL